MNKFFTRISLRERILFIKQLAVLLRAGIPLLLSLQMLQKQTTNNTFRNILSQVLIDVENGQYLANALGKFENIFGQLSINIIAVGEISGSLSTNLEHLVTTLKKHQSLRQKLISASVYPIFIIIATIIMTIVLTVFVFPKILPVFKSINYQLPWTTRFLIFINTTVKSYWLLMLIGIIILIIGFLWLLKNKKFRHQYDMVLIKTPFLGKLIKMYNTANISRTLGLLLNSQVSIVRAFQITSQACTNRLYKKALQEISEKITEGEKISTAMNQHNYLFLPMIGQMIAVGESTGKLSDTFLYLADMYEQDLDDLTKNLSTTVEPLLLIFMGCLVGFIAISIITPIYGITQHLTPR